MYVNIPYMDATGVDVFRFVLASPGCFGTYFGFVSLREMFSIKLQSKQNWAKEAPNIWKYQATTCKQMDPLPKVKQFY